MAAMSATCVDKMSQTALDPIQRAAQEQFSKQSKRYGKGHILENIEDVSEALGFIRLPVKARVLDVACGAGHTGLHLASLGHEVTCADVSADMLARTRENAAARGLTIETRQQTAESMPYPDPAFDLVTCRVAPHHFSSPALFVREAARVLRPSGWLLVIDGTIPDSEPEAGEWLNRVEKLRDPSHVRLIAPGEWCQFCENAGLKVAHHWLRQKRQPDLEWYFETAATSAENRREVLEMIASAPTRIRDRYQLAEVDGKIVWQWPMLSLLAQK
jgi:ubiquinone/menaquinone biosynthesis C-methylase UbiE